MGCFKVLVHIIGHFTHKESPNASMQCITLYLGLKLTPVELIVPAPIVSTLFIY